MEKIIDKSVENLIEKVSSKEPVPGGGAVSALSASIAASLCQMSAELTIGKKSYNELDEDSKSNIIDILEKNRELKTLFLNLFEKDNMAFQKVMDAFKLPKETDDEKEIRKKIIEEAYYFAMEVPLEVARRCIDIFEDIEFMVKFGNQNCITDVGVASIQTFAAIQGAILNVKINLSGIKNEELIKQVKQECTFLITTADKQNTKIQNIINMKLL